MKNDTVTAPGAGATGAGESSLHGSVYSTSQSAVSNSISTQVPATAISLRLPLPLLERIKVAANKRDVPYQSLIKTWLAEKVDGV
jgi:predicted DNA binding CopG/RHH family protein